MLEAVEVGGLRSTGRCLPLRAFENRVYEVELDDDRRVVIKFHRPGRWSREAILDEHAFLADLADAELPVVPPLDLGGGRRLGAIDGIFYAVFPKVRGRVLDELDAEQRRQLGRTIGRLHAVGAAHRFSHRPRLTTDRFVHESLDTLVKTHAIPDNLAPRYRNVALAIAQAVEPGLAAAPAHRLHGDLHLGNVLWTREGPVLVDFDDCLVGPPVQDLWLIARGDAEEARRAREDLLEGYTLFREFDRATLALCERLRALRIVYMSAWIARRWDDPSFPAAFPTFRDYRYWMQEYEALIAIAEALP